MKLVLHLRNTKDQTAEEMIFDRTPVLFGRSRICDVTIADSVLSRQHCSLEVSQDGKLKLVDLNSANGTFFNGQKITQQTLEPGQTFSIGQSEIRITRLDLSEEESTLEELLVEKEPSLQGETLILPKKALKGVASASKKKAKATPSLLSPRSKEEVTLKTPAILRPKKGLNAYKTKDWVQVSLFWQGELVDIHCFDRGDVVTLGEDNDNDFQIALPSLPPQFKFLKILPTGVEIHLHPAMKGVVETRGNTRPLEDLRNTSRQTEIGLATFVEFSDRLLIEVGPFSLYIQSVQLDLAAPLSAPWVEEPFFAGLVTFIAILVFGALTILGNLQPGIEEQKPKEQPVVKLEAPNVVPPHEPPPPPPPPAPKPPPPKKPEVKKVAKKAVKKEHKESSEGAGARALGQEGKSGRSTGHIQARARPIGIITRKEDRLRTAPKGAFGKVADRHQAKRGLRPDQGTGSGKPKPKGFGAQAPSKDLKPKVNVEDQGVLGALNGKGGGGSAAQGGVLQGRGLGGELEGSVEGLERGTDTDSKGNGGRGAKGLGLGGGGSSLEVGGLATKGKGGGKTGFGLGSSGKKGDADVSYSVEQVEVLDGLTREEILRVVRAHEKEIQACYEKALIQSKNQSLNGRLTVGWFVNSAGRVENVSEISGVADGGILFSCVSQRISTWQFPKPRGGKGAQISWPWVFHKAS